MTGCPACAAYPSDVLSDIDVAGRKHRDALAEIRAAESSGRTVPVSRGSDGGDAATYDVAWAEATR